MYDYYIQINVSRVNGNFLEKLDYEEENLRENERSMNFFSSVVSADGKISSSFYGKKGKKDPAVASIFFKFSHKDKD